ncbi:DUF1870 family protein [uncultured Shewanella sp.]|uniref:Aca2/YdiL-like domain-containing protein n=1 Tax=uncultured Shewanella sp. TaxID=173975 RepID=UPI00260D86B1|nr:DUF1870 family protein [uncultured Shewanella sp.]
MSWLSLNSFELQAVRKLLYLDVSEAAEHIGKVSNRSWQYWEAGRTLVPSDVEIKMYELAQWRSMLIKLTLAELVTTKDKSSKITLKWYHNFDAWEAIFPNKNKVLWRLHQSVCAYLFEENERVELDANAPLNTDCFMYQWLSDMILEKSWRA